MEALNINLAHIRELKITWSERICRILNRPNAIIFSLESQNKRELDELIK